MHAKECVIGEGEGKRRSLVVLVKGTAKRTYFTDFMQNPNPESTIHALSRNHNTIANDSKDFEKKI